MTMRAWYLTGNGIDGLTLRQVEQPQPGPGEIAIRVEAASLNFRDLVLASRGLGNDRIPLSDGAGLVMSVGQGVTAVRPGDRVAACFFPRWMDGRLHREMHAAELGGSVDGMLAEVVIMPATGVVPVPRGWSAQWASTLPCAALTAWNALNEGQPLRPGQTVLLLGTGGVSVFGLQFARMLGARTIITSSSDAKLERMKALGADLCINYQARPDWERDVIDATDGEGADLILEVGGGNTLEKSMRCVATGGQIAYIGMVAGDAAIDPRPLIGRAASLRGIYVGNRRMFREMVMAIDQNGLEPVIDRVFPFHQAPEAYRHLQAKDHVGKVVIAD